MFIFFIILYFIQIEINSWMPQEEIEKKGQKKISVIKELNQRKCTDVLCLIIYIIFSLFYLLMAFYFWANGNFKNLSVPYDPDGKSCGIDHQAYPYIYFASPQSNNLYITVCVSECPTSIDTVLKCAPNSLVTSCTPSLNTNANVSIYDSKLISNALCSPISLILQYQIKNGVARSSSFIQTIFQSYEVLVLAALVAIIFCLILFRAIRLTKGNFMKFLFITNIVVLVLLAAYMVLLHYLPVSVAPIISSQVRIPAAVGLIVIAIFIIIMYNLQAEKLTSSEFMLRVSINFVQNNYASVILLPLVLFLISVVYMVWWLMEARSYLALDNPSTAPRQMPFQHFTISGMVYNLTYAHLFHLVWTYFIIIQVSSFIIKGAACGSYFLSGQHFKETMTRLRKKHLGSVCLGGFLSVLFGFLKILYEFFNPDMNKNNGPCLKFLKSCIKNACCCCEMILMRKFNSGAYVLINLSGDSYFVAAEQSYLLRQNEKKMSSYIYNLLLVFNLIMKTTITFLTLLIVSVVIQFVNEERENIENGLFLLILSGMIGFMVICFCISVYIDSMEAFFVIYLQIISTDGKMRVIDVKQSNKHPTELIQFLLKIEAEQQKKNRDVDSDDDDDQQVD